MGGDGLQGFTVFTIQTTLLHNIRHLCLFVPTLVTLHWCES